MEDAGTNHVLALEADSNLVSVGEKRISSGERLGIPLTVNLRQVDLSEMGCSEVIADFGSANAIFCHFALHYFWKSPSFI